MFCGLIELVCWWLVVLGGCGDFGWLVGCEL